VTCQCRYSSNTAFVFIATWKWYYAPNTYKELKLAALRKAGTANRLGVKPEENMTVKNIGQNPFYSLSEFVTVLGPYFVIGASTTRPTRSPKATDVRPG
jgi:hypothetical protein